MLDTTMFFTVVIGIMIAGLAGYLIYLQRKAKASENASSGLNNGLQLQAYERLTVLADRIALPNLIARLAIVGLSAQEMQEILLKHVRDEFEYNISQQIYVSADAWSAIKNLREQNLYIINQVAQNLPLEASSSDLNKQILAYLMNDKKGRLHELVSEVLSYEAKKII